MRLYSSPLMSWYSVHEDPAESGQQPLSLFVRLVGSGVPPLDQIYGLLKDIVEDGVGLAFRRFDGTGECRPRQPHGEGVAGKNGNPAGVFSN